MRSRPGVWLGAVALLSVAGIALATKGPAAPASTRPGSFAFAALGDAPYQPWEMPRFRLVLSDLAAHDLVSVIHIGDIFWHPCTDALYLRSRAWFDDLPHPVVYTPGDNEWTDCWESGSGGFAPLERLLRLRAIFYPDPSRSAGGRTIALVSQGPASPDFPELVENARWLHEGYLFATVHLVGSYNGLVPFPARSADDDAAVRRRTAAAAAWIRESFAELPKPMRRCRQRR